MAKFKSCTALETTPGLGLVANVFLPLKEAEPLVVWAFRTQNVRILAELKRQHRSLIHYVDNSAPRGADKACRMGVVARVVTTAMSTNMAKSLGERTPRSSPTFRTTSS